MKFTMLLMIIFIKDFFIVNILPYLYHAIGNGGFLRLFRKRTCVGLHGGIQRGCRLRLVRGKSRGRPGAG